jgi:hypothetical protein
MQSLKRIGPIAIDLEFSRFFRGPHVKNSLGLLRANKTISPKPVKELLTNLLQIMCIVAADDSSSTMLGPKSQHGLGSRGVVSNSGERGSGRSSTTIARGATAVSYLL